MNILDKYSGKLTKKADICALLVKVESDEFETESESNAAIEQLARTAKCSNPIDVIFYADKEMTTEEIFVAIMTDDSIKL
jgi:hypothetical protein